MGYELTNQEIEERIAVLKRFRSLLEQQRTKFKEYLKVLEAQESKISEEDAEALLAHSELETQIVRNISSLQKVIVPMQEMYSKIKVSSYDPRDIMPITKIQNDLEKLQTQVLKQNEKNRMLLKTHMSQLRQQIQDFKNPYKNLSSIYGRTSAGTRIAVEC